MVEGIRHHQADRLAEAETAYRAVLAQNPDHPEALLNLGVIAYVVKRYDVAQELIGRSIAVRPNSPEALANYGSILQAQDRHAEALEWIDRALALREDISSAHVVRSHCLRALDRWKEASAAWRRAVELKPSLRKSGPLETSKCRARREREGFFEKYCQGRGIDIGWGGDLLAPNCTGFDFEDGDSQTLEGVADASFDFAYSSHNLEHMRDPAEALANWWRVVRPGGFLIFTVPHRDLYEKRTTLPSRFNKDHKHYFLPDRDEAPVTIGVEPLIRRVLPGAELVYLRVCNQGNTVTDPDQHADGEYQIETVLRKPLPAKAKKGRKKG